MEFSNQWVGVNKKNSEITTFRLLNKIYFSFYKKMKCEVQENMIIYTNEKNMQVTSFSVYVLLISIQCQITTNKN